MNITKQLYVTNRDQWRNWLEKYHDKEREVWLIYYKKGTGRPRIPYDDAVEEALCFGWIDSIVKKIDEERFVQKFTPRKASSKWSVSNKMRVAKLITQGRMTEHGLKKVTFDLSKKPEEKPQPKQIRLPATLRSELSKNAEARDYFNSLAPSHRRNYIAWILDAKHPETRARRIEKTIQMLKEKRKLGIVG